MEKKTIDVATPYKFSLMRACSNKKDRNDFVLGKNVLMEVVDVSFQSREKVNIQIYAETKDVALDYILNTYPDWRIIDG